MNFTKKVSMIFTANIILRATAVLTAIIIARMLGPTGKGIISLTFLLPSMLIIFSDFGVGMANTYYVGRKKYRISVLASNSLFFAFISGILVIGLVLVFFENLYKYFFMGVDPFYIYLALAIVPFSLLGSYFGGILLGTDRIKEISILTVLNGITKLFLIIIVLYIFKKGVLGVVLVFIFVGIFSSCIPLILVHKRDPLNFSFNQDVFKNTINYGIQGHFANIFGFLNYRLDIFLVSFFIGVTSVGYYSVAVGLVELVWFIPNAVQTILFPQIATRKTDQDANITATVCRHTLFISAIVCIGIYLMASFIIRTLFGYAFLPAVAPLIALLPGVFVLSLDKLLCADLLGRGRPEVALYASSTALISNVILNIFFIPIWGITGAAIASSITYFISTAVVLYAFLKITKNSIADIILFNKKDFQIYLDILKRT